MPAFTQPLKLSVIVPVYNERATAREALDALLAKEIPNFALEIIIVESNSTDGSRGGSDLARLQSAGP